jgi:hypothetical protein
MSPRIRAALIHLGGSSLLAIATFALAFLVWYPAPLSRAVGLERILLVLLGVDVVAGPFLTFVIYKPGKRTLRFDLAVIIFLQLVAFAYGFVAIAQARPAWLVFNLDRFDLAQAQDLDQRHVLHADSAYRSAPWLGPKWVAARNPDDLDARNTLMFESAQGGPDLPQRIDLYVPLEREAASIRARAKSLDELARYNSADAVQAARTRWPQANAWLPLSAKTHSMSVLLHREDARVIAVVDLRPWKGD